MGSQNADSLFNNIPLEETIAICTNTVSKKAERVEGLPSVKFKELFSVATKEFCFIFNWKFYKQTVGVAIRFPLGLTLADAFLVYFE